MKSSIRRRVPGRVALAAAPMLAAVEEIAPWGWPLRYDQRLGLLLPPTEAVMGPVAMILPPR